MEGRGARGKLETGLGLALPVGGVEGGCGPRDPEGPSPVPSSPGRGGGRRGRVGVSEGEVGEPKESKEQRSGQTLFFVFSSSVSFSVRLFPQPPPILAGPEGGR